MLGTACDPKPGWPFSASHPRHGRPGGHACPSPRFYARKPVGRISFGKPHKTGVQHRKRKRYRRRREHSGEVSAPCSAPNMKIRWSQGPPSTRRHSSAPGHSNRIPPVNSFSERNRSRTLSSSLRVVITTTLIQTSTNTLPQYRPRPNSSPQEKYPAPRHHPWFTYAYVPTFVRRRFMMQQPTYAVNAMIDPPQIYTYSNAIHAPT